MDAYAVARGRRAFWLTVGALGWGLFLVIAALVVPVYSAAGTSAPSGVTHGLPGETLVQINGLRVLFVIGAPFLIAALVWGALHHKCSTGRAAGGYVAWTLIAILFGGCVIGILSVGVFMAPAAVLLAWAAAITPQRLGVT